MANPTADFPTAIHTPTDVSGFGSTALGSTTPKHTEVEGKQEQELAALGAKLGAGDSPAASAATGDVLMKQSDGSTEWDPSIFAGLSGKFTLQAANVVNDAGADVDQRFEGDTDANLLFLDASADKIGIGNNAPSYKLDVTGMIRATQGIRTGIMVFDGEPTAFAQPYTDEFGFAPKAFAYLDSTYNVFRFGIQDSSYGAQGISFQVPFNNNYQDLIAMNGTSFAPAAAFNNAIQMGGPSNLWKGLYLGTTGLINGGPSTLTGAVGIDGALIFNEAGADKDARFEGDTDANLIFLDASTDKLGIGTATPFGKVDIQLGADGDGANDPGGLALQFRTGGYRHFIQTRHSSGGAVAGNSVNFFINTSGTTGGSSIAGTGNVNLFSIQGDGIIRMPRANQKLQGATGLTLEQTGDSFGTTRLAIQNRVGVNGALFEQAGSVDLIDFVFKTLSHQRQIRVESRSANVFLSAPEMQFGIAAAPSFIIWDKGAALQVDDAVLAVDSVTSSRLGFAKKNAQVPVLAAGSATILQLGHWSTANLHGNIASGSFTKRLDISTTESVFNESGLDHDTRIEGDTDTALLFADASTDRVGIGTNAPLNKLDLNDDSIRVRTALTPATAGATGNQGEIAWDTGFIYVCTATNTWKRAAIATW